MLDPVKLEPRPPETLPTNPPSPVLRPAPAMPETPTPPVTAMTDKKPWYESIGIVSALTGIFWFLAPPIASMLGLDIAFLKDGFQTPDDLVPLAALVAALWGRLFATKRIG